MEKELPVRLADIVRGYAWTEITIGHSAARTYRLDGGGQSCFLKLQPSGAPDRLEDERARMDWLQGKLPVPETLYYGQTNATNIC